MSLMGIHYIVTKIFKLSNEESLILLIPTFLICFPAVVYGYYLGIKRHIKRHSNSSHIAYKKTNLQKMAIFFDSCIKLSLIIIPNLIGFYFVIIKMDFVFGITIFLIGAIVSTPILNKLFESFKKGKL